MWFPILFRLWIPTQSQKLRAICVCRLPLIFQKWVSYCQLKTKQKNTFCTFQRPPTKSIQLHKNVSLHFTSVSTETLILQLEFPRQTRIARYITSIAVHGPVSDPVPSEHLFLAVGIKRGSSSGQTMQVFEVISQLATRTICKQMCYLDLEDLLKHFRQIQLSKNHNKQEAIIVNLVNQEMKTCFWYRTSSI